MITKTQTMSGGYIRKGGSNTATSQVQTRRNAPTPMKKAAGGQTTSQSSSPQGGGDNMSDTEALRALAARMLLLEDGMRGLVQRAIDEEPSEKVRDLLYEISEGLNLMANIAHAAVPNAPRP
jgi:hypothetical protein